MKRNNNKKNTTKYKIINKGKQENKTKKNDKRKLKKLI